MERTQIFELMSELKLYGMKTAYDEIMATGIKRQHEPPQIVGDRRLLGVLDAGEDPHAQGAGELERRGAERGHGHAFPRGSVVEMSIQPKILPASAQAARLSWSMRLGFCRPKRSAARWMTAP